MGEIACSFFQDIAWISAILYEASGNSNSLFRFGVIILRFL